MKFSLQQLLLLARRNSTKAMALQASVKRGTAKVRNRRFETTQAIVGCKPHASAVYDDQRLGRQIEDRDSPCFGPLRASSVELAPLHRATVLGFTPCRAARVRWESWLRWISRRVAAFVVAFG